MSSAAVSGAARTALVLGGTSDIALAIVRRMCDDGLEHVVLAARDVADIAERAPLAGVDCTIDAIGWDALDVERCGDVIDQAAELLGRVDVVICAVGMLGHHAGASMGPSSVDEMVRTNFAGPAAALAAVGSHLAAQGSGAIVVLSSIAGVRPRRSNYVYGSTKAGLDSFSRGLADALHHDGVRVLTVRPGFVRSRMTTGLSPAPFATDPDTVAAAVVAALARGRSAVVWVPRVLGPLFSVLAVLPTPLWRRIAGDR